MSVHLHADMHLDNAALQSFTCLICISVRLYQALLGATHPHTHWHLQQKQQQPQHCVLAVAGAAAYMWSLHVARASYMCQVFIHSQHLVSRLHNIQMQKGTAMQACT
jgi:hypothetical protein